MKSHEMTSLKEFARQRTIRQRQKRMRTRVHRKAYTISELQGEHMITYQICLRLKNTDNFKEAERLAKESIKILRNRLGSII